MANANEVEGFSSTLEECAENFYTLHREAKGHDRGISHVRETMYNFIAAANALEDNLELLVEESPDKSLTPELINRLIQISNMFDIFILFTRLADGESEVVSADFPDGRSLTENYKLKDYLQKLPYFSQLLTEIKSNPVLNALVRLRLTTAIGTQIQRNKDLIDQDPDSNGGVAARYENPALLQVLQELSAKNTSAIGISIK